MIPQRDLSNGEYAFATGVNMTAAGRFFTFGIRSTAPQAIVADPEVDRLCANLESKNTGEVERALKELRKMDAPQAVPKILPCLNHSSPNIIRDACRTLAVLGNKETVSAIEPLLKHNRADVRKDAQEAIDRLKDKP